MLYIFDIDNTLQKKWSNELMPGVADWFKWFNGLEKGHELHHTRLAFATNQGAVGLRMILERQGKDASKYPTRDEVIDRMHALSRQLTGDQHGFMAVASLNYQDAKTGEWAIEYNRDEHYEWWNPEFRKPASGMLEFIMVVLGEKPENTTMIGDSEDDRQAAMAAGVEFVLASEFFGGSK